MWFWWTILACDLIVPTVQIVAGYILWRHCPKKINHFLGYRTLRSMKNSDTWDFANRHCGRAWLKVGLLTLIPTILVHIPFYSSSDDAVGILGAIVPLLQCAVLALSIIPTEKALKRTFNEDGTRRNEI